MLVYALIPARAGSKGLPNKNVLAVDGVPLVGYSIAFGNRCGVDRTIVSTDSAEYARICVELGAECPFLRSEAASTDTAMEEDILEDLDRQLPRAGIRLPDLWVWLKPTCPFRSISAVQQAIAFLMEDTTLDSVRIVSEGDARLHVINDDGFLEPLLKEMWDPRRSKMRRSEFPRVYQPFNLEVFRHQGWREWGAGFMGRRIKPLVLPRITGLDVDDRDGFEIIKAIIEARPRPEYVTAYLHVP